MNTLIAIAVASWVGVLATAVDPNTSASWAGGVAALTLLTIAIGFNIRQYRNQAKEIKQLKIEKAKDKRECNWQIRVLADVLDANGIPMPANFWNVPEDPILQVQEEETNRRRRMFKMSASDTYDESGAVAMNIIGISLLVIAFMAALIVLANWLIINPIREIRSNSVQAIQIRQEQLKQDSVDRCVASLTADQFSSIVYALESTPDSVQRVLYANLAAQAADRIRNRVEICKDGVPDNFVVPPPPSTTTPPSPGPAAAP